MEDDGEYDSTDQDCSEDEVGDASEVPTATEFENQAENLVHKRTRGPTKCKAIHARELEERETVIVNDFGQPIQDDKICNQFSSFLGTVARSSKFLPLHYVSWPHVPKEKKLNVMNYVKSKYIFPPICEKWVMKTVSSAWRIHKCSTKRKMKGFKTRAEKLANCPDTIPTHVMENLLDHWEKPAVKEQSARNTKAREGQVNQHKLGRKSYARQCHQLKKEKGNDEEPTEIEMFLKTRKVNEGPDMDENTRVQFEELQNHFVGEGEEEQEEIVWRPNLRFHGRDVTPNMLKRKHEGVAAINQEKGTTANPSMLSEDVQKRLDQQTSQLSNGLRNAMASLKESNPSLVIPQNMFDFLLVNNPTEANRNNENEMSILDTAE
ncbi:unnamed protein product [Linum trigynum]|uniref:Uncharacterized protein n=1 Tax=Linum trigynum TaxID=586398 RepID=A0AAV2EBL0_9ROSI